MSIDIHCSTCGAKGRAPDSAAGRKVRCPECGQPVAVPGERPQKKSRPSAELDADLEVEAPPRLPRRRVPSKPVRATKPLWKRFFQSPRFDPYQPELLPSGSKLLILSLTTALLLHWLIPVTNPRADEWEDFRRKNRRSSFWHIYSDAEHWYGAKGVAVYHGVSFLLWGYLGCVSINRILHERDEQDERDDQSS